MSPARTGGRRRGLALAALACAAALALPAVQASAAPGPAISARATQLSPADVRLVNAWSQWRLGRAGPVTPLATASRSGRLLLRLGGRAPVGATRYMKLVLPPSIAPTTMSFRITYSAPGAVAFISRGSLARRVWSRKGGAPRTIVGRVALQGRRVIYIGLRRRAAAAASASLTVRAYAISTASIKTPLPGGSGTVAGGRSTKPSVPKPGEVYNGPEVYWGGRLGGDAFGAGYGDAPWDRQTLARFEADAGKRISLLLWGQPWKEGGVLQPFGTALYESVRAHGAIPIIDWSPWELNAGGVPSQPDFQLADIINGSYDAYIHEWAADAAAWGKPFFLRFCHEMNGSWYPWSENANGNAAGEFAVAWRHVHDIFTSEGATNVSWLWAPNEIEGYRGIPYTRIYPGHAYVDWVGMSGYNWGTTGGWRSFAKTFTNTYATLRTLAPSKPIMIAELGSSENGGSKAAWIRDALQVRLPQSFPSVKAVVWWNRWDDGLDWPIQSSPSARIAFAESIASPYFAAGRFSSLAASPIPPP